METLKATTEILPASLLEEDTLQPLQSESDGSLKLDGEGEAGFSSPRGGGAAERPSCPQRKVTGSILPKGRDSPAGPKEVCLVGRRPGRGPRGKHLWAMARG